MSAPAVAAPKDPIAIGRLIKPRGVKGELVVLVYARVEDRFDGVDRVFYQDAAEQWQILRLEGHWYHGDKLVAKFQGYDSPEKSRSLAGMELWLPGEETVDAPDGSFHQFEILGLKLVDHQGREYGEVIERISNAVGAWWKIRREDGREYLFPETGGLIEGVDLDSGTALINWVEGLDEVNAD